MNKIKGKEPAHKSWLLRLISEERANFAQASNPNGMGAIRQVTDKFAVNVRTVVMPHIISREECLAQVEICANDRLISAVPSTEDGGFFFENIYAKMFDYIEQHSRVCLLSGHLFPPYSHLAAAS